MARGRRGSRGGSKKIDYTRWEGVQESALALGVGTVAINLIAAASDPQTILRTRLNLLGFMDGTGGPGQLAIIGVGFILVPQGQGTTVIWSPLSDPNAPWFLYAAFSLGFEEQVTDVVETPISAYREVIDSKAMRIQRSDVEVQMVVENATAGNAANVNVVVSGRMLIGV